MDNMGSCTYDTNVCDILVKIQGQLCPIVQPLGLPCLCDFVPSSMTSQLSKVPVQARDLRHSGRRSGGGNAESTRILAHQWFGGLDHRSPGLLSTSPFGHFLSRS